MTKNTKNPDAMQRQLETLQERVARLSAAVLRVSASLDLATVLQEAVDSARDLTGASYGAIATVDETGRPQQFLSSGITPEEHGRLAGWSGGPQLFEHLRDLPSPMRVADVPAYLESIGLTTDLLPYKTMQATPMRHRGVHVGSFYLTEKEGGQEFTDEDEEVLVLFAAQAAAAIANARAYRDEQRARADLEALVDTSPVGVVVFDARTGRLVSLNREAKRMVSGLGRPIDELLQTMTVRRADGREVALTELPLAQQLSSAETVRAEEIKLSAPDGRSVKMLINATPIPAEAGDVESLVVTMQDLAPLEELERMRAEFLAMVSHELRAPLTSIKGSAATVLDAVPALDAAAMLQFFRLISEQSDHMHGLIGDLLDQGRIEAGTLSVSPEPTAVADLVEQARNTFLSAGGRHAVRIDLPEDLPPVMADRQRIVQVLSNLFSNAARHAPESSPIRVTAARDGVHVAVSVADDGRGVPPDRLPHLFRKHAGGADGHSLRGGGVGLGLVICKGLVEAHGGRIWAESAGVGRGTRVTFTAPVAEAPGRAEAAGAARSQPEAPRDTPGRAGRTPVLVVDDDQQMLRYVRDALTAAGYAPLVTGAPDDVPGLVRKHRPQLVLLDLVLPGADGIELMEQVEELADLPVIFISAYGRDEIVARALDAGAADYIVKPFSPTELTARVRAALRRRAEPEPFVLGELVVRYEQRRVTVAGRPVELTPIEYELLRVLSLNAGRVLTYHALRRQAWGERDRRGSSADRKLVTAVVRRLRQKLADDDAAGPAYILNERGVGYRMPDRDT